jgi:hypothetical protein
LIAGAILATAALAGCGDDVHAGPKLRAYAPVNGYWFGDRVGDQQVVDVQAPTKDENGNARRSTVVVYDQDPVCYGDSGCFETYVSTWRPTATGHRQRSSPRCWRRMRGVPTTVCGRSFMVYTGPFVVSVDVGGEVHHSPGWLLARLRAARNPLLLGTYLPLPDCRDAGVRHALSLAPKRLRCPT